MQAQIVPIVIAAAWLAAPARPRSRKPSNALRISSLHDARPQRLLRHEAHPGSPQPRHRERHRPSSTRRFASSRTVTPSPSGLRRTGAISGTTGAAAGAIKMLVTASFAKDGPVDLRVRGSGDLDAEVPAAATLSASVAGSGDLALRGSASSCEITISGSGDVAARSLECATTTEVAVHGSGDATLQGKTKSCKFEIHGSGDITATTTRAIRRSRDQRIGLGRSREHRAKSPSRSTAAAT